MTGAVHDDNKRRLAPVLEAQMDFEAAAVRSALDAVFARDAAVRLAHPFEDLDGAAGLYDQALAPLMRAMPDLERRDMIVIAGRSGPGGDWVGCGGDYCGTFTAPFLDIPPTGHAATLRYHEFYRFEEGRVVEMQALWDLPDLMMQAGAWPMSPSLGREWRVPGPMTQDGLLGLFGDGAAMAGERDEPRAAAAQKLVGDMLASLKKFADEGVEAMRLEDYWHPRMTWYGPSGIGTGRGVQGFRDWHQIPFLNAMPDRKAALGQGHLFAERDYVGFTAWPGMAMTLSGDGWLGIAPAGQKLTMRSLDFWRCEKGLIRENWVLVDLLHVYAQLGVDVLARMREFQKARRRGAGGV